MQLQVSFYQHSVEELVQRIFFSQRITRMEEDWLSVMLAKGYLNEDQQALINRVFYGIRHGLLQLVD